MALFIMEKETLNLIMAGAACSVVGYGIGYAAGKLSMLNSFITEAREIIKKRIPQNTYRTKPSDETAESKTSRALSYFNQHLYSSHDIQKSIPLKHRILDAYARTREVFKF